MGKNEVTYKYSINKELKTTLFKDYLHQNIAHLVQIIPSGVHSRLPEIECLGVMLQNLHLKSR